MGIGRDASEAEIKKAFKKLAIKFHPDKNQDDPETAKTKFQKIANAYETLSDPDKRRIYNQQGEEGVREHEQREGQGNGHEGMNHEDMFSQFFGRGGGRHQQRQEVIPDLFENTDVISLDLSGVFKFYRRQEIWIIYFFNPKLEDCKKFKDEYATIASKLYGIIKVGAVDCL